MCQAPPGPSGGETKDAPVPQPACDDHDVPWVDVCAATALEQRSILPLRVGTHWLLLIRDGDRLYATDRACPHQRADLAQGLCRDGKLRCPRHMAWFDLESGSVTGWYFDPLKVYPVRQIDDRIEIQAPGRAADFPRPDLSPKPPGQDSTVSQSAACPPSDQSAPGGTR